MSIKRFCFSGFSVFRMGKRVKNALTVSDPPTLKPPHHEPDQFEQWSHDLYRSNLCKMNFKLFHELKFSIYFSKNISL